MTKTCLIVEDSSFLIEIYKYNLKELDLHILEPAMDGKSAVDRILSEQPDLVILDLVLPELSGVDVLKKCVSEVRSKFLVISSLDGEDIKKQVKTLGALAFLEKPFKKSELVQVIQSIMIDFTEVQNG